MKRFHASNWASMLFVFAMSSSAAVPGTVTTDWIGNTFGFGEIIDPAGAKTDPMNRMWIQNYISSMWVAPDGRVFAYSNWDEGSRAAGIYKDGKVLGQLAYGKDLFGGDGDLVGDKNYVYTTTRVDWGNWERHGFGIQRYALNGQVASWTGGKGYLNSYIVLRDSGTNPSISRLALDTSVKELYLYDTTKNGTVFVFNTATMAQAPITSFALAPIKDMATDNKGGLWAIQGQKIQKYTTRGIQQAQSITNLKAPTHLSIDRKGRLLVFDDSTLQVHIFTKLSGTPVDSAQLGTLGGIYSGVKGKVLPDKLLPKVAGVDSDSSGNIYLAWGGVPPVAGSDIRSYSTSGSMNWQLLGHTFVACGGFDPATDGLDVYYRDHHYKVDYTKPVGKKWSYESFLWDRSVDTPTVFGGSLVVRNLKGVKILASTASDQYGGGFKFYRMNQQVATPAGSVGDGSWAWWIEPNGNIWSTNAYGKLRRYPFKGFDGSGNLIYDPAKPDTFPLLKEVQNIQRIYYDSASDAMYLSGYDNLHPVPSGEWGRVGTVLVKYSGWRAGTRKYEWTSILPRDNILSATSPSSTLKDMWVEGDYAFFVTCNSTPMTTVYVVSLTSGTLVGNIVPGPEIAGDIPFLGTYGALGWVDMVWGLKVHKRVNGMYVILLEDDLHAKNVMYLWCPSGTCVDKKVTSVDERPIRKVVPPIQVDLKLGQIILNGKYRIDGTR